MDGDAVRIERLTRRKRGRPGEEIEILLSDASSFFLALRVWEDHPIHEGDTLSRQQVHELQSASLRIAVRAQSLSLLARAEHSRFMVVQKLLARGHDATITAEVLDALEEEGLLDDERFAESWVRHRIRRHPEGPSALIAGLRHRGVAADIADAVVDRVLEVEGVSMEDEVRNLTRKLLRARDATPRKVAARLLRRGFAAALVRRIVEEESDWENDMNHPSY